MLLDSSNVHLNQAVWVFTVAAASVAASVAVVEVVVAAMRLISVAIRLVAIRLVEIRLVVNRPIAINLEAIRFVAALTVNVLVAAVTVAVGVSVGTVVRICDTGSFTAGEGRVAFGCKSHRAGEDGNERENDAGLHFYCVKVFIDSWRMKELKVNES
jgi:hypothetical protein